MVSSERADSAWDDYAERVLRNEERLDGLESLVTETRVSDSNLTGQRTEALAREMERRVACLRELIDEERAADRRDIETRFESVRREGELALSLLREVYDTAIKQNNEQARESIHALEQRRVAATDKVEQMVRQWRESDREARELFAEETKRHLEQLNHNNERMAAFQANAVTRELWQSERDAAIAREGLLRDQIIALDRTVLARMPIDQAEKTHAELRGSIEKSVSAAVEVLNNKIAVVDDKVSDLRSFRDTSSGRSAGYTAFYGWVVAGMTLLLGVVITANALLR